jgi:hypothetical protein
VTRNRRLALIICSSAILAVAVRVTVAFGHYSREERHFPSIRSGDSRASVVAEMGMPNYYKGKCGVIHVPSKNCTLEYVYSHPFAPLIPKYHIVSFSADDRVIDTEEWDSP